MRKFIVWLVFSTALFLSVDAYCLHTSLASKAAFGVANITVIVAGVIAAIATRTPAITAFLAAATTSLITGSAYCATQPVHILLSQTTGIVSTVVAVTNTIAAILLLSFCVIFAQGLVEESEIKSKWAAYGFGLQWLVVLIAFVVYHH